MAKCISPLTLKIKGEWLTVPCNKCNFCLQNRRLDWSFRLYQELKKAQSANFLTLTYADEHLPLVKEKFTYMTLNKSHAITFHKTLRKAQHRALKRIAKKAKVPYKHLLDKWKLKYYTVGEYGGKYHRPHMHTIAFNIHPTVFTKMSNGEIWNKGNIKNGSVTYASVAYVTKYVIDKNNFQKSHDPRTQPFQIMSKGIGVSYLAEKKKWHKKKGMHEDDYKYYVIYNGRKQRLPRYFKDKIFTNLEKLKVIPKAEELQLLNYCKEIERLSKLHHDPTRYYEDKVFAAHEKIRIKSKQLNTF